MTYFPLKSVFTPYTLVLSCTFPYLTSPGHRPWELLPLLFCSTVILSKGLLINICYNEWGNILCFPLKELTIKIKMHLNLGWNIVICKNEEPKDLYAKFQCIGQFFFFLKDHPFAVLNNQLWTCNYIFVLVLMN